MEIRLLLSALFVIGVYIQDVTSYAISWDPACGVTKGCFPSCQSGCDYLVKWSDVTGSGIRFELLAAESNTDTYLAIGFSDDYRMGDDGVIACMVPGTVVESSYNRGDNNDVASPPNLGLTTAAVSQANGVISCNFTRAYVTSEAQLKDLNEDHILMLVVGTVETKKGKQEMKEHALLPWSSDGPVDFNSNTVVGLYKLNSPLVKTHGILMILAWMLFSTVGIVVARYNKDMLPDKTLLATKIWFQVHRGCMFLTLCCVVVGFIIIFVHIDGYSQIVSLPSRSISGSHPILGIIITGLTIINPVMALFRPGADHNLRWVFNWAHFGVGVLSQLIAVVAMFFGAILQRAMLPDSALYVLGAHLLVTLIAVIVYELLKRMSRRGTNDVPMKDKTSEGGNDRKIADSSKFTLYILAAYVLIVLVLAVVLLAIIAGS